MCSTFVRKTGRNFAATMHVVPCLITFLIKVTIFHASNTVSVLIGNVNCIMKLFNMSADFMNTLPATLVGSLDNDNTGKLVVSAVGRCNTSSFMKHVDYITHNTSSAAFCVLTICFNDMNVAGAGGTIAYKLVTSFSNVVTTVVVDCVFFFWEGYLGREGMVSVMGHGVMGGVVDCRASNIRVPSVGGHGAAR